MPGVGRDVKVIREIRVTINGDYPAMSTTITGGCQCGAVRYESAGEPIVGAICHCDNCKKFSGTGHAVNMVVPAEDFTVTGALSTYSYKSEAGSDMVRYFCPVCGSPVYGHGSGNPAAVVLRVGGFDDPGVFEARVSLFTPLAAPWDMIDAGTAHFDAMPPPKKE